MYEIERFQAMLYGHVPYTTKDGKHMYCEECGAAFVLYCVEVLDKTAINLACVGNLCPHPIDYVVDDFCTFCRHLVGAVWQSVGESE